MSGSVTVNYSSYSSSTALFSDSYERFRTAFSDGKVSAFITIQSHVGQYQCIKTLIGSSTDTVLLYVALMLASFACILKAITVLRILNTLYQSGCYSSCYEPLFDSEASFIHLISRIIMLN